MRHLRASALALTGLLADAAAQDQPAPGAPPPPTAAVRRSTSLYEAWIVELLHADPARSVTAYNDVVDDATLPREERLVALARLLPLAALRPDPGDIDAAQARVRALLGRPASDAADAAVRRLTDVGAGLRAALRTNPTSPDLDALAAAYDKTRSPSGPLQGLRGAGWGGADSLPEVQRRMLRAAEERGDSAEASRLRRLMASSPSEADGRSPRARQIQRWARDAIESELAGQRDKAARLRASLALLRTPGRSPASIAERFQRAPERMVRLTIDRLQTAVQTLRDPDAVSERERDAAQRALAEAQRRVAAGDLDGAVALLWPAAVLMRTAD